MPNMVGKLALAEVSRDFWAGRNGCDASSQPAAPAPCVEFQGCRAGVPVVFCEHDEGHWWSPIADTGVSAFLQRMME